MKAKTMLLIPLIFALVGAFQLLPYNLYFPIDMIRVAQKNFVTNGDQYLSHTAKDRLSITKLEVHFIDEAKEKNLNFYVSENVEPGFSLLVISPSTNKFVFKPADTLHISSYSTTLSTVKDSIQNYIDKKDYDASVMEARTFLKAYYSSPILKLSLFLSNFMVLYGTIFIPLFIGNNIYCKQKNKHKNKTNSEH